MNYLQKLLIIASIFYLMSVYSTTETDLVIFSCNRPLQLYAFLESIKKYVTGINQASVVYRADNDDYKEGYEKVKAAFPDYLYFCQGKNPEKDFKAFTIMTSFYMSNAPYIMYGVDDIVVKDYVDLSECTKLMQKYNAYAFYLRLGKNLTECYSLQQQQPLPSSLTEVEPHVFSWKFNTGSGDWGYPYSIDMTIFLKMHIKDDFYKMIYHSPNSLEGQWSSYAHAIINQIGLCYEVSKIVNFPLNLVQKDWNNRHMNEYSAEQLLSIFMEGKKMDIAPVHQIYNPGAHTEYSPTFVERLTP